MEGRAVDVREGLTASDCMQLGVIVTENFALLGHLKRHFDNALATLSLAQRPSDIGCNCASDRIIISSIQNLGLGHDTTPAVPGALLKRLDDDTVSVTPCDCGDIIHTGFGRRH